MMETPTADWRYKLGIALFALSIVLPLVGVPVVTAVGLSATMTASVSGALLMGGEVLGIVAVAVIGKPGYAYIKARMSAFIRGIKPPRAAGRVRYAAGLVMFCVPLLFAWISIYIADYIPGFAQHPLPYATGGDLILLLSLFVLGADFWDKVKALFIYDVKVCSPRGTAGSDGAENELH